MAKITVIGRKTGKKSSMPVQFIYDAEERIFLLPFMGKNTGWYLNLMKNPTIMVSINGTNLQGNASLSTEPERIRTVIKKFKAKYGEKNIEGYYPKKDAVVEVVLQTSV
jgi:deazaflavin-dependent oxidoreductase (nitroreductase family)